MSQYEGYERAKWRKVWGELFTSPSHLGLHRDVLWVLAVCIGNASTKAGEEAGLMLAGHRPMTLAALAGLCRMSASRLRKCLAELADIGEVVTLPGNVFAIPNMAKWQEGSSAARTRRWRQNNAAQPGHKPVTVTPRVTTEGEVEVEGEAEGEKQHQHQSSASFALQPNKPSPPPATRRRDAVVKLHAWFEAECVRRQLGRNVRKLSGKWRTAVDAGLRHIRETLDTDHAGAVEAQRRHLQWRLETCGSDEQTRSRMRQKTPWQEPWWTYWHANVADAPAPASESASDDIATLYAAMVASGEISEDE